MKECQYVNCNNLHNRRSPFCKPSHKTRQWELDNKQQNPIVNKKRPKRSPSRLSGSNKRNVSHSIAKAEIFAQNPNNSVSQSPRYYSELVPRQATFNATKIAFAIASVNEIRKPSRRRNVSNVGKALLYGFAADVIWNLLRGNTTEILHEIPIVPEVVAAPSITRAPNSSPLINALDYRKHKIQTINFNRQYRQLLGRPPKNFYAMVHGQSGHGKSYWAIQFAEYFKRNHGKVIYFAAEQRGMNLAVQNILNEVEATFQVHTEPRSLSVSDIKKYAKSYDLLVFDSFNEMDLNPEQIKEIRKSGKAAILGVLQSTKDGQFKGDNTWLHDTDIMVQLVNRVANTEQKARYNSVEPKVVNINVNS